MARRGTSANLGTVLGLEASVVKSLAVVEKLVQAFVLAADKKMEKKMELDEVATQFYHALNQVDKFKHFYLVLFPVIKVLTCYLYRRW